MLMIYYQNNMLMNNYQNNIIKLTEIYYIHLLHKNVSENIKLKMIN